MLLSPMNEIHCDHSVHDIDGGCSLKLIQNQIIPIGLFDLDYNLFITA